MIVSSEPLRVEWSRKFHYTDFGTGVYPGVVLQDLKQIVSLDGTRSRNKVISWRGLVARNLNAVGAYTRDTHRVNVNLPGFAEFVMPYTSTNWPFSRTRTDYAWGHVAGLPSVVNHLSTSASKADSLAVQKILDKIRRTDSTATGLTSLGELRQTIKLLKNPYEGMVRLVGNYVDYCDGLSRQYSKARKAQRRPSRQAVVKELSGAWLETTYGLLPLLSDVANVAEAIARFQHDSVPLRVMGRGSYLTEAVSSTTDKVMSIRMNTLIKRSTEHRVQYTAGLDFSSVAFGSAERLRGLLGISLSEFVPTLWELTPWSFLVDYFTNVGDVINAATTDTSKVTWISRAETTMTKYRQTTDFSNERSPGYGIANSVVRRSLFEAQRTTFVRSNPTSFNWPQLRLESPWESGVKTANMLALFTSRLNGITKRFT